MEKFVIQGGSPLSGEITAAGNKNAALPILAACLLTDEELVLTKPAANPRHGGADRAAREPRRQGGLDSATTSFASGASAVADTTPDDDLSSRIRASFLLAGPLLARFGQANMLAARGATSSAAVASTAPRRVPRHGGHRKGERECRDRAPSEGLKPARSSSTRPPSRRRRTRSWPPCSRRARPPLDNAACEPHVQDLGKLPVTLGRPDRRHRLERR